MGNGLSFGTAKASKGAKEIAKTIIDRNDSGPKKCRIVAVTYVRDSNESSTVVTTLMSGRQPFPLRGER